jgi:exosortase
MRAATTAGSVGLLEAFAFPIHREGYSIHLPNLDLFIADSCSGIRYLVAYFVFGLAYAFVSKKTLLSRLLAVSATLPLSVLAGIARQSTIFLAVYYIGPFMAGHKVHVMISWSVFLGFLLLATGTDQATSRWWSARRAPLADRQESPQPQLHTYRTG